MRLVLTCLFLLILSVSNASARSTNYTPTDMIGLWGFYGCSESFSLLGLSKYFYFSAQPGNSFIQPILDHIPAEDFIYLHIASNIIFPVKLIDQDNLIHYIDLTVIESADYSVTLWENLEPVTAMSFQRCSDDLPEWLNEDSLNAFNELDTIFDNCSGSIKLRNPKVCLDTLYRSMDHDQSNTVDISDLSLFYRKLSTLDRLMRGKPYPADFLNIMSEESPVFVDTMITVLDQNKDNLISSVEFEENWSLLLIEQRFEKTKSNLKYLLALIDARKINPEIATILPQSTPVDSNGCEIDPDYYSDLLYETEFDVPLYID